MALGMPVSSPYKTAHPAKAFIYHTHALLNCFGEDLHCNVKDNKFHFYIICAHRAPFTAVCLFVLQFAYMRF